MPSRPKGYEKKPGRRERRVYTLPGSPHKWDCGGNLSQPRLRGFSRSVSTGRSRRGICGDRIMTLTIRRIEELTPDLLDELLCESERAGLRFVRRLVHEWASGANCFDRPGEGLFAAWIAGRVVGVCGLNADPYTTLPRIGRLRHLYVLSGQRRRGIGQALVRAVIEAAQGVFDRLRLRTDSPEAARFYEGLGFGPCVESGDYTYTLQPT
jgi:GNAT superfamily N-acetyltransferase